MSRTPTPSPSAVPSHPPRSVGGGRELAVVVGLFALLAVLRFVALSADPPPGMMLDFLTDEGWWAHNARNHALFGHWNMDEHNEALIWAPLYTGALRVVYALLGVGLVPTRLLAAGAGLATCVLVYAFLRRSHGWVAAAIATFLLGADYFSVSHHRTGFVESFQAFFITAACLATVAGARRRGWACGAGVLFVLALFAKVTAVVVAGIVLVYWLVLAVLDWSDRREGAPPAVAWSTPMLFAAGALVTVIVAFVLIAPDRALLANKSEQRAEMTTSHNPILSALTVGLLLHEDQCETSGFFPCAALLLLGGLLLAVHDLAYRTRRLESLEIMCWCWFLVGVPMIGFIRDFQPDRRFLFVVPPLAILLGKTLAGAPRDNDAPAAPPRARALAAGVFAGLALGFALRAVPTEWIHFNYTEVPLVGGTKGIGPSSASLIVWVAFVLVVAPPVYWLVRRLPERRWHLLPVSSLLVVYAVLNLGRIGLYLAAPSYSMRRASETIAALAAELPPEHRVAVGDLADTLGMDSNLFTFVIRRWPEKNMFMNLDGWERFAPALALDEGADHPDLELRTELALIPDRNGLPRRRIPVRMRRFPPPVR